MIALTSSAVLNLASCVRRFCPAHTEVWITFRKSWPVRGLMIATKPFMGLVVVLPSKVWCIVTRYTLLSSPNHVIWLLNSSW